MTNEEIEWRKLCLRLAEEQDPAQLSEMVEQLIEALDALKQELEEGKPQIRGNSYEA